MMKKLSKILILIILLFSVGMTRVYASSTFVRPYIIIENLKTSGLIKYNWNPSGSNYLCSANPGSESVSESTHCHIVYPNWFFYYINNNNTNYYTVYCLHVNKGIIEGQDMVLHEGLEDVKDISDEKKNLLKKLLLYGYNPNTSSNIKKPLENVIQDTPSVQLRLIAMQVLVWEIMEGGRTSFNSVAPNYTGDRSFYKEVIYPNGGDTPTKEGTLYYYYKTFVEAVKAGSDEPENVFESSYTMKWNSNKYSVTINPGNYTCSVPSNSKVTLTSSNGKITLSSTEAVSNVEVTCKFAKGNDSEGKTEGENFKYYTFDVTDDSDYQDMIYGSGWKVYNTSFKVSSENAKIKITKTDLEGKSMSKNSAKFKFTLQGTNKSVTIGNGTTGNIEYSGKYTVEETLVPAGYKALTTFYVQINATTRKITDCTNASKTGGKVTSCLNGAVVVNYNNDTIELSISNEVKNITIKKTDSTGKKEVTSAVELEVRNSSNKVVKFNKVGNIYKYDTSGTITKLSGASSYSVSLLPDGKYKIVETKAPENYLLPKKESLRTTNIQVKDGELMPLKSSTVVIKNYQTKFSIHKIGDGNPLEGVKFKLYNEDKTVELKCNSQGSGIYNYSNDQDSAEYSVFVTNSNGDVIFNYLPEGVYWVREIETLPNYELPQGDSAYIKVEITYSSSGVSINNKGNNVEIVVSNTPYAFNFYKKDTEGNALTTGEYKLQKYDEESKKYIDLKLVNVSEDDTKAVYQEDKNGKIIFTLKNGMASFTNMHRATTYRIIETKAPEGYTKADTKDAATVHIDENGYASGLLVLVDQKIVKEDDSAYAELIINIQTGKERIMYGAVIFVIISIIAGLIIYNKKK